MIFIKIDNYELICILVSQSYNQNPPPPPPTEGIGPSISSTFFIIFHKNCYNFKFSLLYPILSEMSKKSILPYNIRFLTFLEQNIR